MMAHDRDCLRQAESLGESGSLEPRPQGYNHVEREFSCLVGSVVQQKVGSRLRGSFQRCMEGANNTNRGGGGGDEGDGNGLQHGVERS